MHSTAGSPTEPFLTLKHTEKSEQKEKIEKAKLASTVRSRPSQPSLLPSDFPSALGAQLVTISSPRDLLSAHVANNDRRLRRLLCRYINQIQYGCKNLYCMVPTCLTCRQRKSKTPLRRYTDASARALAAHIIDEQGEKGLCHSDPVVPWFETPGSRPMARSVDAKSHANGHAKHVVNGHPVLPASDSFRGPGRKRQSVRRESREVELRQESDVSTLEESVSRKVDPYHEQQLVRPVDLTDTQAEAPVSQMPRRDPRSFTQAIFHSFRLRSLWTNLDTNAGTATSAAGASTVGEEVATEQDNPKFYTHKTYGGEHDSLKLDFHLATSTIPLDEQRLFNEVEDPEFTSTEPDETSEAAEDQHPKVQVAPVLSEDFLNFFICHRNDTARDDMKSSLDRPGSGIYDDLVKNSIFFCLGNPWRTLQTLRDWHKTSKALATYDRNDFNMDSITHGIHQINDLMPVEEIFHTVRLSLAEAYRLPAISSPGRKDRRKSHTYKFEPEGSAHCAEDHCQGMEWLSDEDTARLCAFGLLLLQYQFIAAGEAQSLELGLATEANLPFAFVQICNSFSRIFPEHRLVHMKDRDIPKVIDNSNHELSVYRDTVRQITDLIDYFDDYNAKNLFSRIVELVAARCAFAEIRKSRRAPLLNVSSSTNQPSIAVLIAGYMASCSGQVPYMGPSTNATVLTIEWTRLLFTREWNGNAVVKRASPLGGSLQLLMAMFLDSREYALDPTHFYMPLLADRLNMVEMPVEWLSFRADNKNVHLLSYSFLFEPQVLVSCFRAINYSRMSKAAIDARAVQKDVRDFTDSTRYPHQGSTALMISLRPYMANNFVITIRRDNLLEDAINQIWRRQRRELMRPLKVRMGMDEGEQGIDIGGVQQEFFRMLFAQALDPDYGMFTTDERTRMTWFKPGALVPLYKFEVLGVFMSLAMYNSITLPVTFPIALYRKVLGLKVKRVHQIADGWPELATGLQKMLDWKDGDVSDVFARTYEFSYEAFGKYVSIDMKRFDIHTPWPPTQPKKGKDKLKTASFELPPSPESGVVDWTDTDGLACPTTADLTPASTQSFDEDPLPDEEAPLVTNADREQYVKDYITWLTHRSIESQYKSFAKGFYTCLDRTALSIFTPEALKTVVEGHTAIDIDGLEAATKYEDGYDEFSPTIQDFWHVVRSFSTDDHRRLLEFVTATARVPVNGIKSVQFIIQRNGSGDDRLPTSMTCFGRLLLPQYSSRAVLAEKLSKAVENSEGFGVA